MNQASNVLKEFSDAAINLVEAAARSVVAVHGREWGQASGIIVKPGVVVTAEEALDKDEEIEITLPDGANAKAKLVGRDPSTDVAVLRFQPDGAGVAKLGDAASLRAGTLQLAMRLALACGRDIYPPSVLLFRTRAAIAGSPA